jgi:hypothetical protein
LSQGQVDGEGASLAFLACDLDPATMVRDDLFDQGHPNPQPTDLPAVDVVRTAKPLKELCRCRSGDADAVVGDGDRSRLVSALHAHVDRSTARAVVDRVLQQGLQDLFQAQISAQHGQRFTRTCLGPCVPRAIVCREPSACSVDGSCSTGFRASAPISTGRRSVIQWPDSMRERSSSTAISRESRSVCSTLTWSARWSRSLAVGSRRMQTLPHLASIPCTSREAG